MLKTVSSFSSSSSNISNVTTLTVTSLTGYMYANNTSPVTASVTIPNNGLANSNVIIGNTTITLGSTVTSLGNVTLANANISATTTANATFATSSLPLVPAGYISILLNGTTVKIPYYAV